MAPVAWLAVVVVAIIQVVVIRVSALGNEKVVHLSSPIITLVQVCSPAPTHSKKFNERTTTAIYPLVGSVHMGAIAHADPTTPHILGRYWKKKDKTRKRPA
jgi:hypothetical protein